MISRRGFRLVDRQGVRADDWFVWQFSEEVRSAGLRRYLPL